MWASETRPGVRASSCPGGRGRAMGRRGCWGGPPTGDPSMQPSAALGRAKGVVAGEKTCGTPSLGGRKTFPSRAPELWHLGK